MTINWKGDALIKKMSKEMNMSMAQVIVQSVLAVSRQPNLIFGSEREEKNNTELKVMMAHLPLIVQSLKNITTLLKMEPCMSLFQNMFCPLAFL